MSDTDTSDEALDKWLNEQKLDDCETYWFWEQRLMDCWQECRRRCEAQRKDLVLKLMYDFEERERKAFEAGLMAMADAAKISLNIDEAYRAFKEAREIKE